VVRQVGFYATVHKKDEMKGSSTMQGAEKISITMTPEFMRVIRDSVQAGEYASTSEVLRDAMRVWVRQRAEDAERLAAIRTRIRRSLDDPRPDLTGDEVDARLEALLAEQKTASRHAAS
jgi:antitoxin ParD1/3/4